VVEEFKKDKKKLLLEVMNDSSYLENLCGVQKMIEELKVQDIDILEENDF
jgi:hypothetical protein